MFNFEICANSVESCLAAQEGGAHRVELCANIPEGGTTPSCGEITIARQLLNIKLHVIIRPRGGDFLYSEIEAKIMEEDIRFAREAGVDGVVFGCLDKHGDIDVELTRRLIAASEGLSITFHRAFDQCRNPFQALGQLIELGCDRILTSGQQPTAEKGIPLIKQLVDRAGDEIIILPGSGINKNNISAIAVETGAKEFHFSARKTVKSEVQFYNPLVPMNGIGADDLIKSITSAGEVKQTILALHSIK